MPRYTDLALGACAVLTVGLAVFALRPGAIPDSAESPGAVRSQPTTTVAASATMVPSTAAPGPVVPVGVTSWIVGAGGGGVVRAAARTCGAEGWTTIDVIGGDGSLVAHAVEGLRAVGGIRIPRAGSIEVMGVDAACAPVGFGSTDSGATWRRLDAVPAFWALLPGNDAQVQAPSGAVGVPCVAASVTGFDARVARVGCTDGRLLGTVTGGTEWSILGNNKKVRAVGYVAPTTALALTEDSGCAGVLVAKSTDGGGDFRSVRCVEGTGPWGLGASGGSVVVTGADVVGWSDDAGANWRVTKIQS